MSAGDNYATAADGAGTSQQIFYVIEQDNRAIEITNLQNVQTEDSYEAAAIEELIEVDMGVLCRLCATQNEYLIPIFEGEGLQNELGSKINSHLPIQVFPDDALPLLVCYQCASQVISWHDLRECAVKADQQLRELHKAVTAQDAASGRMEGASVEIQDSGVLKNEKLEDDNNIMKDGCNNIQNNSLHENYKKVPGPENVVNPEDASTDGRKTCDISRAVSPESHFIVFKKEIFLTQELDQDDCKNNQCSDCSETFMSDKNLITHESKEHRIMKIKRRRKRPQPSGPFLCSDCGGKFKYITNLNRHKKAVHLKEKNYVCATCGRAFSTRINRDEHEHRHTNMRPYVCDTCSKSFLCRASLATHKKIHIDVFPFKCDVCSKTFKRRQELKAHSSLHTNVKPFQCDTCPKRFRIKSALVQHNIRHSNLSMFLCDYCERSFKQKRYLKQHMDTKHAEEEDYETDKDSNE